MSRKEPEKTSKPASAAELRQQRLADALRANLKRRKAFKATGGTNTSGKHQDRND